MRAIHLKHLLFFIAFVSNLIFAATLFPIIGTPSVSVMETSGGGIKSYFYEQDQLLIKEYFSKNGICFKKEFYEPESISQRAFFLSYEELFLNGLTYTKKYYPGLKIAAEGALLDGDRRDGVWKYYDSQGTLLKEMIFDSGIEVRPRQELTTIYEGTQALLKVVEYFPNNSIKNICFYDKGTLIPTGIWQYYVQQDNKEYLSKTEKYTDGQKTKMISFYIPEGTSATEKNYKSGQLHGPTISYDRNGVTLDVRVFVEGEEYFQDGQKRYKTIPLKNSTDEFFFYEYFENGSVKLEGQQNALGRQGHWSEYQEDSVSKDSSTVVRDLWYQNNVCFFERSETVEGLISIKDSEYGFMGLRVLYDPVKKVLYPNYYVRESIKLMQDQLKVKYSSKTATGFAFQIVTTANVVLLQGAMHADKPEGQWVYYKYVSGKTAIQKDKEILFKQGLPEKVVFFK